MPLSKPPPLGHAVPDDYHAISVQLPTWQDMCDMALGEPRVKGVQEYGYPRSFLHKEVRALSSKCLDFLDMKDCECLIFSRHEYATSCKDFVEARTEKVGTHTDDGVRVFTLESSTFPRFSRSSSMASELRDLYVVVFPPAFLKTAMGFWRLSGLGISSRFAQKILVYLPELALQTRGGVPGKEPWHQAHQTITERILDLLKRASISPDRAQRLSWRDVFLYQSGMSAIYHLHKCLLDWRGCPSVIFGFPYELTLKMLETYGPGCTFYAFGTDGELDEFENFAYEQAAQGQKIQALWCECPSNPLLRTPDLVRLRKLADRIGFPIIIDDTIGSFANIDLLDVADVVVTSLTKSFSGYSNVMAGSVILNPVSSYNAALSRRLGRSHTNNIVSKDATQLEINSRDFLSRAATINETAIHLVTFFESVRKRPQSCLTAVYHPSVCWSVRNYEACMRVPSDEFVPGYGGLFTLEFSSITAAASFFDHAPVHKGPSLGAQMTLMQPYVQTVFFREKEWAARNGVKETIVRISVGLEEKNELLKMFAGAIAIADEVHLQSVSNVE